MILHYTILLLLQVALIIGIAGACRKSELTYLRTENVLDEQSHFRVSIPNTHANLIREFVITQTDIEGVNSVEMIRRYMSLRPGHVHHNRFFIKYYNGRCSVQPVGINTFGIIPKRIAEAIGLPNPDSYTGHCFRRSSATLLAGSGINFLKIKRYGIWKAGPAQDASAENSQQATQKEEKVSSDILAKTSRVFHTAPGSSTTNRDSLPPGIHLTNCNDCVINITLPK